MTEPTPGLPYIAGPGRDAGRLFRIVAAAMAAQMAEDRDATGIRALVAIPAEAYLAVPTPPAPDQIALNELTKSADLRYGVCGTGVAMVHFIGPYAASVNHKRRGSVQATSRDTPVIEIRNLHKATARSRC